MVIDIGNCTDYCAPSGDDFFVFADACQNSGIKSG